MALVNDDRTKVGGTSKLIACDAQTDEAGDPSNVVALDAEVSSGTARGEATDQILEVTPPSGFLDDPTTKYPVIIDPDVSAMTISRDTWVRSGSNENGSDSRLIVGKINGDSNVNPARTYVQFDTADIEGFQLLQPR